MPVIIIRLPGLVLLTLTQRPYRIKYPVTVAAAGLSLPKESTTVKFKEFF